MQPSLPPLSGPLPRSALHLPTFGHVRAAIPISDNLFSVILRSGHTTTPHAKHGEHRDIALFELGPGFFGTIMVSRKCIPSIFALRTGAKLSEFCHNRPWDLGITFGSHGLKPQHLEDKVFLMGQGMLGGTKQTNKSTTKGINPLVDSL